MKKFLYLILFFPGISLGAFNDTRIKTPSSGIYQDTPSGGTASGDDSFIPSMLDENKLWLRSDQGVYTSGASTFTSLSSQYLIKASSPTITFSTHQSICGWVKFSSMSENVVIVGKGDPSLAGGEYSLFISTTPSPRMIYRVRDAAGTVYDATPSVTLITGAWYFFAATAGNSFQLTVNSMSSGGSDPPIGITTGTTEFRIGRSSTNRYLDGFVDAVGIWRRELSSSEMTALYNSGAGKQYADLSLAEKVGLQSWWDMGEDSGNRSDRLGFNTLTSSNSVGSSAGIVSGIASNFDPVSLWADLSGNGNNFTQSSILKMPSITLSITPPIVAFDGIDDILVGSNFDSGSSGNVFLVTTNMAASGFGALFASADESTDTVYFINPLAQFGGFPNISQRNNDSEDLITEVSLDFQTGVPTIYEGSSSSGTYYVMRYNGQIQEWIISGGANNGDWLSDTSGRDSITLGGLKRLTEDNYGDVSYHEILYFSPGLSEQNRLNVTNYLKRRYNIP